MSDHVNTSLQFALQAIRDEATKPLHIEIEALTARVAELEAKLGQAQHAYTVTAMELDRYKNPGQTIRLSAADGGKQSPTTLPSLKESE